jgi:tetratricopeptide (TPR) repeat protein
MLGAHPAHHTYSFGEYVLDVARGALLKNGAEVRLRRQSFEVLRYLIEHLHRADDLAARDPGYLPPPKVFSGSLDEAIARQRRIVQRDPVSMTAKQNLAVLLLAAGRLDEAYAEFRDMLELDPAFAPRFHSETAFIYILQARFDDALAATRKSPEGPMRDAALAMIHDALGNDAAAEAALQRLIAGGGSVAARLAADVYARRGRLDEAFQWLQKGLQQARARPGNLVEPVWVFDVRLSPFLVPLHGDPRWERLMALAAPPE